LSSPLRRDSWNSAQPGYGAEAYLQHRAEHETAEAKAKRREEKSQDSVRTRAVTQLAPPPAIPAAARECFKDACGNAAARPTMVELAARRSLAWATQSLPESARSWGPQRNTTQRAPSEVQATACRGPPCRAQGVPMAAQVSRGVRPRKGRFVIVASSFWTTGVQWRKLRIESICRAGMWLARGQRTAFTRSSLQPSSW